jgi:hypothetical protein
LTVNNSNKDSQIAQERADHQSFIQISSLFGQNSYSQRADVLRGRPFRRRRVLKTGNLYRDRQPDPFLKSSKPRRHLCNDLPSWIPLACTGLGGAKKLQEPKRISATMLL